jgi:transposase-like protein
MEVPVPRHRQGRPHPRFLPVSYPKRHKAAKRSLAKALKCSKHDRPGKINTDKNSAYGEAID